MALRLCQVPAMEFLELNYAQFGVKFYLFIYVTSQLGNFSIRWTRTDVDLMKLVTLNTKEYSLVVFPGSRPNARGAEWPPSKVP